MVLKAVEITEELVGAGAFGGIQLSMIVMRCLQNYPMYHYFYLPPIV